MKNFLTSCSFLILLNLFSCQTEKTVTPLTPVNTIGALSGIKTTEVTIEGSVADPVFADDSQKQKSGNITKFGFVYGIADNPTLENGTIVQVGTTPPSSPFNFQKTITGLLPGTAYFVRSFASNLAGTSYSNSSPFTTALYTISSHVASSSNTSGHVTTINNSALNNNPDAIVITTANWQGGSVYNKAPTGLWYSSGKWTIFNQDFSTMPSGVKYNFLVAAPGARAFKHVATSSNVSGNTTAIDHPLLNNNPAAKLLISQRWNGTYNASPVGVYYSGGKWRVFNEKTNVDIKAGAEFNIVIDDQIQMTEAKSGKISGHTFEIEPLVKTTSSSIFVTQYWTGVYNPQEVGVWYSSAWMIYNQNLAALPAGSKFFVLTL